jgi:hypothetical protein
VPQVGPIQDRPRQNKITLVAKGPAQHHIDLVELLRRYSNRDDLLKPLLSVLERISVESPASQKEPQLASADGPNPQAWRVSDRLSPADTKVLVTSYLAGSRLRDLGPSDTTSVPRP